MNIGLIAHDSKKKLMQNFCIAYRGILCKNELYATGTTGRLIEEVTNLNVHKYLAGHLGGVQQLGAQIEHNEIDLVIFLRDPLTPKSHEPDVNTVVRICDTHNIPLATKMCIRDRSDSIRPGRASVQRGRDCSVKQRLCDSGIVLKGKDTESGDHTSPAGIGSVLGIVCGHEYQDRRGVSACHLPAVSSTHLDVYKRQIQTDGEDAL